MAFDRCFYSLILLCLLSASLVPAVFPIGINYGQIANNLPSPENVVPLLQSIGVKKVKLYDADPRVLRAFANTDVEFIVGLGNEQLAKMRDPSKAVAWIKTNVQTYLPETKITCVTVGNEILTGNDTVLIGNLLPAMQNVQAALVTLGLDKQVSVTTAHSLAVLQTSYPPSAGAFRSDLTDVLSPILSFQSKIGSTFLINAYPFFAYKANPEQVPLGFVLFQPNQGVLDPVSNLRYDNMLFAQIDAVYAALAEQGHARLPVQISETGWPSKGDEDEAGATPDNARKYNGNLMKLISQNKGTPMRPSSKLDVYVFALFNENLKPGPTSERNYGLFKPDGTPAYQFGLLSVNSTTAGNDGGRTSTANQSPATATTAGYLTISSATVGLGTRFGLQGLLLFACLSSFWFFLPIR